MDPASGEIGWFPVQVLYRGHYEGNGCEVRTSDRRTLRVTDEHPMLVLADGRLETVPARELKQGDRLPVVFDESSETPGLRTDDVAMVDSIQMSGWVYSMEVEGASTFTTSKGIAVHNCIPLDPFYLAWKAREYGSSTKFIELAGEVNVRMPEYVVGKLQSALNARGLAVKGAKVLVLGLAYKKDIDDTRESPAFEIIELLADLGAEISVHDPHVPVIPETRRHPELAGQASLPLTPDVLAAHDAVVIVTDHTAVDYELVADHAALVVDARGIFRGARGNVVKA